MRASAVSFTHKLAAATLAVLLTLTLTPSAYAEEGEGASEVDAGTAASGLLDQSNDPADSVTLSGAAGGSEVEGSNTKPPTLASGLVGTPSNFINSDVALDGEPVIGSFTIDGLTFAVLDGPYVELVGVAPSVILSEGSEAAGVEESNESHASEAGVASLVLPETISYEGASHIVSSVDAYAFYLSGISSVTLPASISNVDDRAFCSSDVALVRVADSNPFYSSFDGALYDAEQLSLLLIPEGKQGAVLLPKTAEVVEASVFSHCPLVDSISVEKDGAAFASENGLLYTSDLTTLLRVPAGATEITIREGCATIAAGALEACAKLTAINASSTVNSISPDVFHAIPTVSLPAASLAEGAPQLTAMVALSSAGFSLPETSPSTILVTLPSNASLDSWKPLGFRLEVIEALSTTQAGATYAAKGTIRVYSNGHVLNRRYYRCTNGGKNSYDISVTQVRDDSVGFERRCGSNAGDNVGIWCDFKFISTDSWYSYHWSNGTPGWTLIGWSANVNSPYQLVSGNPRWDSSVSVYAQWRANTYGVSLDNQSAVTPGTASITATYDSPMPTIQIPKRPGYAFKGYYSQRNGGGTQYYAETGESARIWNIASTATLYAYWERIDYNLGFDVDSEPGDEDYKGEPKDDQAVNIEDGPTVIEDPKRPGYVFQGWTIPNAEGTEAVDQDLVYQGEDGKWYVDASKLPDYAGDDGRVELTARWTSVISVDVPSSVTFYADVVTQGNESREGLASSAFGQNKVQSQSEVDLRIVGLESKQVKGNGSTSLGASDILKKKDGSAVSGTADKLFSLYPATGELKEDDLKDPDATSASKPVGAVDFSLDDILLEKSFAAGEFTIPAGDTLSLGYRLNLQETDTELDYDKLSALSEGASASIANISYCFAADGLTPAEWGEPFWFENKDESLGRVGYYGLNDIKAAADDLSAHASDPTQSSYYPLYSSMVGTGTFHLKVEGRYIDMQLLGICQDTKTSGGKAGLTFQTKDIYAYANVKSDAAGGGRFDCWVNDSSTNAGGWAASSLRERLRTTFMASLDPSLQSIIAPVSKHHQLRKEEVDPVTGTKLQSSDGETIWLPSMYEVFGEPADTEFQTYNPTEAAATADYEPFQYQAYQGNGGSTVNPKAAKSLNVPRYWWLRSAYYDSARFCTVNASAIRASSDALGAGGVAPCFAI